NILQLLLNGIGYYYNGLTGLGISFFVYYALHFLIVSIIIEVLYKFSFSKEVFRFFIICSVLCGGSFLIFLLLPDFIWRYVLLGFVFLVSLGVSLYPLQKKMDLRTFLKKFTNTKDN